MALSNALIKQARTSIEVALCKFNMAACQEETDAAINELNAAENRYKRLYRELKGIELKEVISGGLAHGERKG